MDYKLSEKDMEVLMTLAKSELYQSSFYYRIAAICNKLGFLKAEKYYLGEAVEERSHFQIHYDYILGRGNDFQVPPIPGIQVDATTLYGVVEKVKDMETTVTKMYEQAMEDVSELTEAYLLQFMAIQTEAIKFNVDACAVLEGLDKAGSLVAEKQVFKL